MTRAISATYGPLLQRGGLFVHVAVTYVQSVLRVRGHGVRLGAA